MRIALYLLIVSLLSFPACGKKKGSDARPTLDVPLEFADMHMPVGWWNDPTVLSEGRLLYQGLKKPFVNCAKCHGRDGKPTKRGAPDLTNERRVSRFSDSYWYWRIAEGIRMTSMEAWDKKLSTNEIWKIIAYQRKFGLGSKVYDPQEDRWIDPSSSQGSETTLTK